MEGSRKEVVRFIRLVVAEFQVPDEWTPTAKLQDWAVNLAWGESDSPASSGMMNIMRREGGQQVGTGTYDGAELERLRLLGQALQRHMRRRVGDCKLQAIHTRAPAPGSSMVDDGMVNANVMRRDALDQRTLDLVEKGKPSVCDPFWLAKRRAGPLWLSNATAPTLGEPLSSSTADVHTGLPMTATLDILRHLWFRGPDSIASAHFAVWRHLEAIAATVKHLQKHVRTSLIKIATYSAVASGRVRTSRDAVPSDRELHKSFVTETQATRASEASATPSLMCCGHTVTDGNGRHSCPSSRALQRHQRLHATVCQCRFKRRRGMNQCGLFGSSTQARSWTCSVRSLLSGLSTPVAAISTQMRSSGVS